MPMAFLGGAYTINTPAYKIIVGIALLLTVVRMGWKNHDDYECRIPPRIPVAMSVGGGIFLSPLLLFFH